MAETVSDSPDLTAMAKALKYAAVLAVIAGVIANLPDIKRYIKISTM
jgi:hypothetical protein